jgi:hypothetical protein
MSTISIAPKFTFSINGATINTFHANLGEGLPKHEHAYAHATQCHNGSIIVRKENNTYTLNKDSQPILLKENEWHEIEALENNTVFCNVFAEGMY